jgi:hypothetical protein
MEDVSGGATECGETPLICEWAGDRYSGPAVWERDDSEFNSKRLEGDFGGSRWFVIRQSWAGIQK